MQKKLLLAAFSIAAVQFAGCDSDVVRVPDACDYCDESSICCDGQCTHYLSNSQHCGKCDVVCGASEYCDGGECKLVEDSCGGCSDGLKCCDVACKDIKTDNNNCGKCGNECPSGMSCQDGRCRSEQTEVCDEDCVSPKMCCDDACFNTDADAEHCGSCDTVCEANEICQNGRCIDPENPGNCEDGCTDGACCGDSCVDLASDDKNCGACGNACPDGLFCRDSSCQEACLCDDGKICNAQGSCVEKCGEMACDDGETCCNDKCVQLNTPDHCGSCENACSGELSLCLDGSCSKDCGDKTLCGSECIDITSNDANCGKCGNACGAGKQCVDGNCECKPKSCSELGKNCGKTDDGCGTEIDCGSCADGEICNDGVCGCKAKTCADLGYTCGKVDNGCGEKMDCGSCAKSEACTNGTCGCKGKTCTELKKSCGKVDDGCGNMINCGTCVSGQSCIENVCNCNKTTCDAQKKNCGEISDGCGGTLNCGTCTSPNTCQSNVCKCVAKTCKDAGKNCGEIDDGCGGKAKCGTCADNETCTNNVCKANSVKDTYPKRKSIKGLQPDFMDINEVVGNGVHGVSMNLVWDTWQKTQKTTCDAGEVKYDGYCFTIDQRTANTIKAYSDKGVLVTAIIYGVPAWCRRSCKNVVIDYFCAPTDEGAKHYARFAGFLANYFNGENGHGRIADFVIHNEVNATEWFNYGCSAGTCNLDTWTSIYADSWNNAYDRIRAEQKNAKVLISLEHNWSKSYMNNTRPVCGGEEFLKKLIPKLGNRDWRLAYHSYAPNLADPAFGADDLPNYGTITFGNIGVIAGWLRKNYPNDPHAWEIQLTENGLNGADTNMMARQNTQLCQAFKNILGTPGIESFIYHRLIDIAEEGLNLGLWAGESNGHPNPAKPAWETYAYSNRTDVSGLARCGFELLPYIKMTRGIKGSMHWITTRQMPSGFTEQMSWKILRDPAENTQLIFECRVGGANGSHTMTSTDPGCEGQFSMGPLGYVYKSKVSGSSAIYRCYNTTTGSHFVSSDEKCEGATKEGLIGYAIKM